MTAPEGNTVDKNSKLWYNENMSEFYKRDDKGGCAFEYLASRLKDLEEGLRSTQTIPEKCQDCPYILLFEKELEDSIQEVRALADSSMDGARDIQDGQLKETAAFLGISEDELREIIVRDAAKKATAQLGELDKVVDEVFGELQSLTESCPGSFTMRAPGIDVTVCENPVIEACGDTMLETAAVTRRF